MGENYSQLNDFERTKVMVMRASLFSIRAIARILKRSPSTIHDELKRNGFRGEYSASLAEKKAKARKARKPKKILQNNRL